MASTSSESTGPSLTGTPTPTSRDVGRSNGSAVHPRSERIREPSLGQLVSDVAQDVSTLVHKEVDLAKAELKVEVAKAGQGGGALGVAAVGGLLVLVFGSLAGVFGLTRVVPDWLAALIVTAAWLVIAAVGALVGRSKLRSVNPKPEQAIESVKEDVRWLRNRSS